MKKAKVLLIMLSMRRFILYLRLRMNMKKILMWMMILTMISMRNLKLVKNSENCSYCCR